MLKIKKGCLITAGLTKEIDVIVTGCNCFSIWGAGLNRQLKDFFPKAYEADKNLGLEPWRKIGGHFIYRNEPSIIGLYTQYDIGTNCRRFEYGALRSSLFQLRENFKNIFKKFGFPRIGSGLGGGNQTVIQNIIDEIIGDLDVTIYELE